MSRRSTMEDRIVQWFTEQPLATVRPILNVVIGTVKRREGNTPKAAPKTIVKRKPEETVPVA